MNKDLFFAYSKSTVADPNSVNERITLDQLITKITNGTKPTGYDDIKNITITSLANDIPVSDIKAHIKPLKASLPYYLFSGYQSTGHNNKGIEYNGCVQIDIDFKEKGGAEKAATVKTQLSKLPYVIFAGISPSGVGVKALVHTTNMDKESHMVCVRQIYNNINNKFNIGLNYMDVLPVGQASYVFFDAELYINRDASTFVFKAPIVTAGAMGDKTQVAKQTNTKTPVRNKSILKKVDIINFGNIAYDNAYEKTGNTTLSTPFLQSYIGTAISFGLVQRDALYFLKDKGVKHFLTEKKHNTITDLYDRYGAQFNEFEIKRRAEVPQNILGGTVCNVTTQKFHLKEKIKISTLQLDLSSNTLIQAPTGVGKSYYVAHKVKGFKILVVFSQSQVEQIRNDWGAEAYYEYNKRVSKNAKFIVTTYNSFPSLMNKLDPSKYTAFLDEAHGFATKSSPEYLGKVLNNVMPLLKKMKNYHLITATPEPMVIPAFMGLNKIIVTQDNNTVKTYNIVQYTDRLQTIKSIYALNKGKAQVVTLFNNTNDDGALGKIMDVLKEFNVPSLNAKKKKNSSYKKIVVRGDMSNFDGCVTTTVFNEGVNVTKHSKDIILNIVGQFSSTDIEQMGARFRHADRLTVIHLKSMSYKEKYINFIYKDAFVDAFETASSFLKMLNKVANNPTKKRQLMAMNDVKTTHVHIDNNGYYSIDYLGICNYAYNEKKRAENGDSSYMMTSLKKFGFVRGGHLFDAKTLSEEEQKNIQINYEMKREKKQEELQKTVINLKEELVDDNNTILEKKTKPEDMSQVEYDLRYRASYIAQYINGEETLEKAVVKLEDIGLTNRSFNQFQKQCNIQLIATSGQSMKDSANPMVKVINKIKKHFTVGSLVSRPEIQTMITDIYNSSFIGIQKFELTKTKCTQLLKTFVTTKRRLITKLVDVETKCNVTGDTIITQTRKRIECLEIVDHNPTGLDINFDKMYVHKNEPVMSDELWFGMLKQMQVPIC